jgi:hypothetical protein
LGQLTSACARCSGWPRKISRAWMKLRLMESWPRKGRQPWRRTHARRPGGDAVPLAILLLAGAGLLLRSLGALRGVDSLAAGARASPEREARSRAACFSAQISRMPNSRIRLNIQPVPYGAVRATENRASPMAVGAIAPSPFRCLHSAACQVDLTREQRPYCASVASGIIQSDMYRVHACCCTSTPIVSYPLRLYEDSVHHKNPG